MFGSDNQAPAHPSVMDAIIAANGGRAGSYGDDEWSRKALREVQKVFETDDLDMYLVATGGAANGLGLSMLCPPWGAVLAHGSAHVVADEGSGPEHFTSGARMIGIAAHTEKLVAKDVALASTQFSRTNVQGPQPRAVTLTNLTENGLAYSPAEISAISEVCKSQKWGLHMDGARFSNAVVASSAHPADLTWREGVDALSFGLTKNGSACAEALIVFGAARDNAGAYLRKRAGHLFSKQRYLAAQFVAMLQDDLWLTLASHANQAANQLANIFTKAGCELVYAVDGNEIFVRLSDPQVAALRQAEIGFYPWVLAGQGAYRFVTCWQSCADDLTAVARALGLRP